MVSRRTVLLGSTGALVGSMTGCTGPAVDSGAGSPSVASTASSPPSTAPSATPSVSASPAPSPSSPPRPTPSPDPTGRPKPTVTSTIADNVDVPWGIAFLRSGDALVSERNSARILRVARNGKVTPLGTVSGVTAPDGLGEGDLLGIALAPGDEDTLFVYLTSDSDNRVVRLSIAGGKVGKPTAVLTDIPTSTHHHGGRLLFDRTGALYVSTGDAEQSSLAQSKTSLAGKILRIRADGRPAAGNPFGNRTWSYGHRNIEGLAFDAQGRLWATEFGDKAADELNLITKGGNYGWPRVEGKSDSPRDVSPKATWSPTSTCSPAGLAIVRSTAFVGALRGQCLFAVPLDGTDTGEPKKYFAGDYGRIRNVVVAPDGALWMTTSNTDGRVAPGKSDDKILRVTL
jgi:glucose/arabinose dehydrogenase